MKINQELCVGCGLCVPYCPVGAIRLENRKARIDADVCVECSCCRRSGVCRKSAIVHDEMSWPRAVRSVMSDVFTVYEGTGVSGRGTEEMKTNDVTGRFHPGWVGVAVELGRPISGCTFRQVQDVAVEMASSGMIAFEPCNPITALMKDNRTGYFQDDILDERVYSAILEFPVKIENLPRVLELCSVTQDGQDQAVLKILREAGMSARPNGKVNLGLGRPAYQF